MTSGAGQKSPTLARRPDAAALNRMSRDERLGLIRSSSGRAKYDLLLDARDGAELAPLLHPQEIYLCINAIGPEYASELLLLTSTEQFTTLIDLDCWEGDRLDPAASLKWLALLLETGEEKACRTLVEMEPELVTLMLKLFIRVTAGPEVYDSDDADANANRLEGLYDIEYRDEEAAKIVGGLLQMLQKNVEQVWIQLLELVRGEFDSTLEEEVYRLRGNRLLDYGFSAPAEARSLYTRVDPATFVPLGGKDYNRATADLASPAALLRLAEPGGLLAEILAGGIDHDLASELSMLANRKLAADLINPGDLSVHK